MEEKEKKKPHCSHLRVLRAKSAPKKR